MTVEGASSRGARDDWRLLRDRALRRLPLKRSLRLTVLGVIALVLIAPQVVVYGWLVVERRFAVRMQDNVAFSADEASRAIADGHLLVDDVTKSQLDTIARIHDVRVRVVDARGSVVLDVDHDGGSDMSQRIGDWFWGAAE